MTATVPPTASEVSADDTGGLPFRADDVVRDLARPLHCVRAIEDVTRTETGVVLRCRTELVQRRLRDRTGTALETADPMGQGRPATIRIDVVTPHVIRVRATPHDDVVDRPSHQLVTSLPSADAGIPADHQVSDDDDVVVVTTSALRVELSRDPYRLLVTDTAGTPLVETVPASVYLDPPTGESHLDGRALSDAWPWFFRGLTPLGWVEADDGSLRVSETTVLRQGEALFGLGERFLGLDKRGQRVDLWHANAAGQTWPEAYKNVPFHLSSRGYGVFLHTTAPVTYHLGDTSATHQTWHVAADTLDWFLIHGPSLTDVLERYTDLTGKPALPPRWSYGLWMSRMSYDRQDQVEEVARELRARDIPADVVHIDTDWFATPWVNDLEFSPERFPDPAGMVARLRDAGFRLSLWQLPYLSVRSRLYAEAVELGHLATRNGEIAHIGGFFGAAGVVDVTKPDAAEWYASKLDPLFDMGIAAIKTDFGEGAPVDADWHAGSGVEVHNLYPLLYNRAVYERTLAKTGEGIIWGRSATAGSQRYPVYWGGDPAARWEDLGNVLAGGLSLALCGFPFWSQDIGGFAGQPTEELYIRWAQCGLFMTHPRAHGAGPREPWAFGERAERVFRRWAKERYRLLPYLWGEAERLAPRGQPVMRPLVLDHADDPTTHRIHDQFLLGRSLHVAPIVTPGTRRLAYLPAGRWVRWATGEVLTGPGWRTIDADLDDLPLFLPEGGIVVRTASAPAHTAEVRFADLEASLVPPADGVTTDFAVAGDDGRLHTIRVDGRARGCDVTLDTDAVGVLEVLGVGLPAASAAGATLAVASRGSGYEVEVPAGARVIELRFERP